MEHAKVTQEQGTLLHNIGYETYYQGDKLTDVATMLRIVHGWHISVIAGHKHRTWKYIVTDDDGHTYTYGENDETPFNTHDLALSAGIDFILTKLNEDA